MNIYEHLPEIEKQVEKCLMIYLIQGKKVSNREELIRLRQHWARQIIRKFEIELGLLEEYL